ncbi:MAG: PD-(D/E)XK nuclease domain-containing protein, partial [Acidobacteria bacterium]|nr:PD-(D/E)XK nuclease domain-containing protein [Acidobacteriota bacterium]
AQLHRYISDKLYWVLHAPRQTGKTTFLQSWMREINSGDHAVSCYVSVERCQGISDADRAMPGIYHAIRKYASDFDVPVPETKISSSTSILDDVLRRWAELVDPKPLIVLFDEVDVLEGETLISFLRQLRGGFASRGIGKFPVSIALVGMRDLKDYITASKGGIAPNPGSPFNIKADSAQLSNFSKNDIAHLFAQRTAENGQQITPEALDYVYEQSSGQPWIVNSLFARATLRILDRQSTETVELKHVVQAREQMIEARETHLDALGERLRDSRIRRVVEPLITGEFDPNLGRTNPDVMLAIDLGLVRWSSETGLAISNPIYAEILTRHLNSGYHDILPPPTSWQWQKPDGRIDMDKLLKEFQKFWRRHSDIWEEKADYTEAFPHLLLMAFLQRVINGGGTIDREYAAGRGRTDLTVNYKGDSCIMEIKLVRSYDTPQLVKEEGLEQIRMYRDKIDPAAPAWLIIFDRRAETKSKTWDERISWEHNGDITVLSC